MDCSELPDHYNQHAADNGAAVGYVRQKTDLYYRLFRFCFGLLVCALSWDIGRLCFTDCAGFGCFYDVCRGAIVSDAFQPNERGKALGLMGTVVAAGSSTGPVAGGLLLEHFGWTSIFYVNIPIGLIAIWRALYVLPGHFVKRVQPFDITGAILFFTGVTCLLIGVDFGAEAVTSWDGPVAIALVLVGILYSPVSVLEKKVLRQCFH